MAKVHTRFVCQACGAVFTKWMGKCDACGAWDTVQEESVLPSSTLRQTTLPQGQLLSVESLYSSVTETPRFSSGFSELDHTLGGGLVKGSAILIGGDPGIGKSTLLLQLAGTLGQQGHAITYVSGEESTQQVRLRADRLGLKHASVSLITATQLQDVLTTLKHYDPPAVLIIDSIQTFYSTLLGAAPGTVSQVRTCAHELIAYAKETGTVLILVGHVTKEGQIAGPKVLEHMVDTVLYFEGERGHVYRIIRAVKNRFGGVNEVSVYEMSDRGLVEITNPSALFLSHTHRTSSGTAVFAGIEGSRAMLLEIQALVAPSFTAMPRRATVGWDSNRLAMLIAVLSTRYGLALAEKEVYLNVVGGLRITEPAVDLAVAAALISAAYNMPLPSHTLLFGEIGLSGEIRPVSYSQQRLKEAVKLGFHSAIVPEGTPHFDIPDLKIIEISHIKALKDFFTKEK